MCPITKHYKKDDIIPWANRCFGDRLFITDKARDLLMASSVNSDQIDSIFALVENWYNKCMLLMLRY